MSHQQGGFWARAKTPVLAVLLLVGAGLSFFWAVNRLPEGGRPPATPAAPTLIVNVTMDTTMSPAWLVHTNLILDSGSAVSNGAHQKSHRGRAWLALSFGPEVVSPSQFSFHVLGWGLPIVKTMKNCGLPKRYLCLGEAEAKDDFRDLPNLPQALFPAEKTNDYPQHGLVRDVEGTGGGSPVVLYFPLQFAATPVLASPSRTFSSFSLPVVLFRLSDTRSSFFSSVTFDTEIGIPELASSQEISGKAPDGIEHDQTVSNIDPLFDQPGHPRGALLSWLWAETDPLAAQSVASVPSTPVVASIEQTGAVAASGTTNVLLIGVLFGVAGGCFVGSLQEIAVWWRRGRDLN